MTPEFDHYSISRVLGEGGTGVVYLAQDRRTGDSVAVRVVAQRELDQGLRTRLPAKTAALSALNHPNVARFREITQSRDGALAVVMEYVDGVDFRAFEGRPFPELLPLMVQAVRGLAYLRSRSVFHGDLSSNNFLVTIENRTRVTKILDLGFAGIFRPEGADGVSGAGAGQFVGKFAFASPEHFFPSDIDWRSDVYSLGVIFHRLLTGEAPITVSRESRYFDWMVAHEKEHTFEVPSPVEGPPLPEALRDVLRRMLARSRDARPRSYEEILEVLEAVGRNVSPALEPDSRSLETLPPPVEGRMGSSGSGRTSSSPAAPPPAARSYPEAAAAGPPDSVEASQQKRWPDLEVPESHTERFVSFSASPSHGIPVVPTPRFEEAERRFEEPERRFEEPERRFEEPERRFEEPERRFEEPATPFETEIAPSSTELLSSKVLAEPTKTAPTVVSERPKSASDSSRWTGVTAKDSPPEPARASPAPSEEKTERLDDVIEKLRQRSSLELLPPLTTVPPSPEPVPEVPPSRPAATTPPAPAPAFTPAPSPPPQPVRRPEPAAAPARSGAPPARAPSKPGQRLVVYGGSSPAVPARRPAPAPAAAPAPSAPPAAPAADRRLGRIGIGLIVAAIVVLFAVVLWVLVAVVRGSSAGAPRRSGAAVPKTSAVAAARPFVPEKPL